MSARVCRQLGLAARPSGTKGAHVEAQDASLAGAHVSEAALADAFGVPLSVALVQTGPSWWPAVGGTGRSGCGWPPTPRAMQPSAGPGQGQILRVGDSRARPYSATRAPPPSAQPCMPWAPSSRTLSPCRLPSEN